MFNGYKYVPHNHIELRKQLIREIFDLYMRSHSFLRESTDKIWEIKSQLASQIEVTNVIL